MAAAKPVGGRIQGLCVNSPAAPTSETSDALTTMACPGNVDQGLPDIVGMSGGRIASGRKDLKTKGLQAPDASCG